MHFYVLVYLTLFCESKKVSTFNHGVNFNILAFKIINCFYLCYLFRYYDRYIIIYLMQN